MIAVIAKTAREAQEYCRDHQLGLGQAVIVTDKLGLTRLNRGQNVRLVGRFHFREDAQDMMTALRRKQAIIEDLTGPSTSHV